MLQIDMHTVAGLEQGLNLCVFFPRSHLKGIKKWYLVQKLQYETIIDDRLEKLSHKDKDQEILWSYLYSIFFAVRNNILFKTKPKNAIEKWQEMVCSKPHFSKPEIGKIFL